MFNLEAMADTDIAEVLHYGYGLEVDTEEWANRETLEKLLTEQVEKKGMPDTEEVDDLEFDELEPIVDVAAEDPTPLMNSPEWNGYVLDHFQEDELIGGNPTVDGLRRVTELLLGTIVSSASEVLQCPNKENDRRATVKVSLSIDCGDGESGVRFVDGVASVYWGNCDNPYRNYPVAVAETRAEGRALRRALRLRKVLAHEESGNVTEHDYTETEAREQGTIAPLQIGFIGKLCKKLDINVEKFVTKNSPVKHNIKELEHAKSLDLQKTLSEYQQDESSIPDDVKGYDSNWESNFLVEN